MNTLLFNDIPLAKAEGLVVFLVFSTAFIVIGILAYYFSRKQRIIRALKKFKTNRITQFRTNELTKITGKVLHVHEPLVAPYSKRKCVAYHIRIEHRRSTGKSSHWKTLVSEHDIQDFFIEHRGEVVMIKPTKYPKNYKSYMVSDRTVNSGTFNDPTPEFERLLKHYTINSETILGFNKRLRYTERIIEVGEVITVGGIAKWKELSEPITEYGSTRIATLESDHEHKLIITDEPSAKTLERRL